MDRVFLIFSGNFLYWNSLILTLAAAAGICAFVSMCLAWGEKPLTIALYVPCALVLSVVLGRFVHWYTLTNQYRGLADAFADLSVGGYALMGAVAACLVLALVFRALKLTEDLPRFLDCLSASGCGAIALGRLSYFFSALDRGSIVSITSLPIAYPVVNGVSGAVEYRFATFLFQSLALMVLFAALLRLMVKRYRLRHVPAGDVTLVFALCYGALAVVLDSTRYDSLYLRSNGFVSAVQILSAVTVVAVAVCYSVRLVKAEGMKKWYTLVWTLIFTMMGGAGFMEYYVQRHGREALFSYIVMSVCLADFVALTLLLRRWTLDAETRKAANADGEMQAEDTE